MRWRKFGAWTLIGFVILVGLGLGGFLFWAGNPYPAMPEALSSLESDPRVRVEREPWITFSPQEQQPTAGFIFYPGGLVEAEAYAPTVRAIAEAGYFAVITPMPLNLAFFDADVAAEVIRAYPEIENWVIGGHSLGGAMAAAFSDQNADLVNGLALWAAYPAESNDLSDQELTVASIYGTLDGLASSETVFATQSLLPANSIITPIEGGNHAQFGWYGAQEGDNPATISREQQQIQIIEATLALLKKLEVTHE